jgi:hypothetical protein
MVLALKDDLIFGLSVSWPDQNPKKAEKTQGNFLDFLV